MRWRPVALVIAGLAIALAVIWLVDGFIAYPTPDNLPTRWDHYRYIAMSRHPFDPGDALAREAPFCWRILAPLLVYLSPLDWRISFMLITLVGLGGAALTLYAYLRRVGHSEATATFGLALFFSLGGLIFNLRDFYLSDPLALFAIALVFYLVQSSKFSVVSFQSSVFSRQFSEKSPSSALRPGCISPPDGVQSSVFRKIVNRGYPLGASIVNLLLLVLVLGVLAKETVLAVLPLVIGVRGIGWRTKLGLCLAPIMVVVGLRLGFPSSNNYSYVNEISDVIKNKFLGEGIISLLMRLNFALLGTWGPVLVLLLYRPRETLAYFAGRKAELIYLAIIYSQVFVAHNVDRLLVYGFMVIIPALVDKATQLSAERNISMYTLLGFTLILQLAYFYGRPPLWASLAICGVLAFWLLRPNLRLQHN